MPGPEVCSGHSGIKVVLEAHEKRLDGHDARLDAGESRMDEIEKAAVEVRSDLKALCQKLNWLVGALGSLTFAIFSALLAYLLK